MSVFEKHQKGFGVVGIVLVVLVACIIATAGTVLYKHSHKGTNKSDSTTTSATTSQSPVTSTAQPTQTAQQYLVIKEWGIKLPYSGSAVLTYSLSADSNTASIASSVLASEDAACTSKGAGVIERFKPTDSASVYGDTTVADAAKQSPGTYAFVNGYYYLFVHSQSSCGDAVSAADQNQANDNVKSALAQATAN